ncbi:TRPM8 channel-associated factor 2-like [Dromaius novaehollandiae]|uniref:TRPM8 channel-associated factor 2-like n=1 Tax=Dromaius novaehollandiae TaxID=8790 RepID=UPI0031204590
MDAYDSTHAKNLIHFVKEGGGLLIGGQAWYWASQHGKEKVLFEFPGNQVTSVAGVYSTGIERMIVVFTVSKAMPKIPLITQENSPWQSTIHQFLHPGLSWPQRTVPAGDVHLMDNPDSLLAMWDKMMNATARPAAIPATFPRPERMVVDVQISNRKYSPVMVTRVGQSPVTVGQLQSDEGNNFIFLIVVFHPSTFPRQIVKTVFYLPCNLWSVCVNETVLGIPRDKAHNALMVQLRKKRIEDYIKNGAQLKDWKVFTVLETYLQVICRKIKLLTRMQTDLQVDHFNAELLLSFSSLSATS